MVLESRALPEGGGRHAEPRPAPGVVGSPATPDDAAYKAIEEQLDFGKSVIDAVIGEGARVEDWLGAGASGRPEHDEAIRGQGATLREIQALLKARDPGFGGLVRVMNKRQEFLWVHPQFEKEY